MRYLNFIIAVCFAAIIGLASSIFTVDQREYALVFQLGEVRNVILSPGLYFKWPLIQNVRYFDRRILTHDVPEPELVNTVKKINVLVDSFIKWRIIDPKAYYLSYQGDERLARVRLSQIVNSRIREEFGTRTVHDVVSGERDKIMDEIRTKADQEARKVVGVEIVDVRLKRVDLPPEVSESVYRRMEAERKRVANESRAEGAAEAEKIRADADRQREVTLAAAYREAQEIKGDGDAQASAIYAQAFGQAPEFYAFYRSLEAYRNSFKTKGDMLVVDPSSDFFKYMKNMNRTGAGH